MTPPTASIIVPSYKGENKLPVLLSALCKQDTSDFETIIVLDGEFDNSKKIIDHYCNAGLPIQTIVFSKNKGRVAALNAGFNAAHGSVLIRCDDDLEPSAQYVTNHIKRHDGPPIGVIGLYDDVLPPNRYTEVYGKLRNSMFRHAAYRMAEQTWHLWAGNCSITRETWQMVGEYSPAYTHYGWEDVDYGYRLHSSGVPVILAPELETIHHGAAVDVHSRCLRAFHSGAAKATFINQHPHSLPHPTVPPTLWGQTLRTVGLLRTEHNYERASRCVDTALPYLPKILGQKAVAMLIESAAITGYYFDEPLDSRF